MATAVRKRGRKWPTPAVPNGGRVIPNDAVWHGKTTAYKSDGQKLQVGLESAVRKWPTPTRSDVNGTGHDNKQGGINLRTAIQKWPTPTARLGQARGPQPGRYTDPRRGNDLDDAVAYQKTFPTPRTTLYDMGSLEMQRYSGQSRQSGQTEAQYNPKYSGQLNLDWVEWLMGWPAGWTALEPLDSIETWRNSWNCYWAEEPDIPRTARGIKNRGARLTALGNGQVPQVAALAWVLLTGGGIDAL